MAWSICSKKNVICLNSLCHLLNGLGYPFQKKLSPVRTAWNDPRPQMIPKIDLNMTRNDPRPQMILEELSEWNGMTFNSQRC